MNEMMLSLDSLLGHVIYCINLTATIYTSHLLTILTVLPFDIIYSEDFYFMQHKIQVLVY